jgi:hypothetical protein
MRRRAKREVVRTFISEAEYDTFRATMRPVRKPKAYLWIYERAQDVETGEIYASVIFGTQPKWEGWEQMPKFIKIGVTRP